MTDAWKNKLYYGDNLDVLRRHIAVVCPISFAREEKAKRGGRDVWGGV